MCNSCNKRAEVVRQTNDIINRAKAINNKANNNPISPIGKNTQNAALLYQQRVNQELQRRLASSKKKYR